jgi:penicillin-binding protein 2A
MAERPSNKTAPKQKPKQKKRKRKTSGRAWLYGVLFTAAIGIVCGIIGYLLIVLNGERLLAENGNKLVFGEASVLYDANEQEIARISLLMDNRDIAEFSEIPELMMDAIIATEDQRFMEHSGIDFFSIGRAVVKDVIARSAVEGGSTITQQLAKNVFLSADKTFFRKATEASIAVALEHELSKQEILTMYLNRIYFGKGVSGVKQAAKYYFDTELGDLQLWQVATLAAMPKGPNKYNPINNPEASMNRRAVVLNLMTEQGYITAAEAAEAKAVVYERPASHAENANSDNYQEFIDYAIEEAMGMTNLSEEELRTGGFKIYTTLDQQAQQAMDKQFANSDNFEKSKDEQQVEGAMVIIDHRDGQIKAMTGGRDYTNKLLTHNRVNVKRQPGSAIKPVLVYGPALESAGMTPSTILQNNKKCFGNYCPTDRWGAVPVSMTQAVKDSRNLAAVWTLNEVGIKKSFAFAEKLGFEFDENDYNLAAALGGLSHGATPMQMATAYSIIANDGKSVDPHSITRIEGKGYSKVYEAPQPKQIMSEQTAYYLTEMMQTVVQKGGSGVRAAIDRPVAGKTGTTQHGIPGYKGDGIKDAWFVGYTPEWTAAVWMGYDKTDINHILVTGSSQSAAFFAKVMQEAMKNVPKSSFGKPQQVVEEEEPPVTIANFQAVFMEEEMKVHLSWDPIQDGKVTYEVFRKEASEADFIQFVSALESTGVDDMSVFPGQTYEYYVVAYVSETDKTSAPSTKIKVTIPETEITPGLPMEPEPTPDGGDIAPTDNGGAVTPEPGTTEPPVETTEPPAGGDGSELPTAPPSTDPPPTATANTGGNTGEMNSLDNGGNTQGTGG